MVTDISRYIAEWPLQLIHDLEVINNAHHIIGPQEKTGENTINHEYPIPKRLTYNRSAKRNANDKIIDIAINNEDDVYWWDSIQRQY